MLFLNFPSLNRKPVKRILWCTALSNVTMSLSAAQASTLWILHHRSERGTFTQLSFSTQRPYRQSTWFAVWGKDREMMAFTATGHIPSQSSRWKGQELILSTCVCSQLMERSSDLQISPNFLFIIMMKLLQCLPHPLTKSHSYQNRMFYLLVLALWLMEWTLIKLVTLEKYLQPSVNHCLFPWGEGYAAVLTLQRHNLVGTAHKTKRISCHSPDH